MSYFPLYLSRCLSRSITSFSAFLAWNWIKDKIYFNHLCTLCSSTFDTLQYTHVIVKSEDGRKAKGWVGRGGSRRNDTDLSGHHYHHQTPSLNAWLVIEAHYYPLGALGSKYFRTPSSGKADAWKACTNKSHGQCRGSKSGIKVPIVHRFPISRELWKMQNWWHRKPYWPFVCFSPGRNILLIWIQNVR